MADKKGDSAAAPDAEKMKELERLYNSLSTSDATTDIHKFWDTQPVPKLTGAQIEEETNCAVDEIKTPADVRDDPYKLPKGFEWAVLDFTKDEEIHQVYDLLTKNYVEDDDAMFRFDYSVDFLRWALTPPGYHKNWLVGVRQSSNGRLLGFISGIPVHTSVRGKVMYMAEINFLCVHKKLRTKRLAPVLIKEITRRVNKTDGWQAVYTAGVVLPRPVGAARYYHRTLNAKKLIDIGFTRLAPRMTMARTIKLYRLPQEPHTPGFRVLNPLTDFDQVHKLLTTELSKYALHLEISREECEHMFTPRDKVVNSYVVEDPQRPGVITDFCSFYHLPSTIIGHAKYDHLSVVYSFYNVANSVTLTELVNDLLIMAKKEDVDVFNALALMENAQFLDRLKFGRGDGNLHYYLYNWQTPQIEAKDIGIVLL